MNTIPHKTPPFGYFPRPDFTEQVHHRMVEFRTNLALFAPRRRGKTTWALLELHPATAAWGLEFAYLNLWANRSDPVGVLAKGLEMAAGLRPDDGRAHARRKQKSLLRSSRCEGRRSTPSDE